MTFYLNDDAEILVRLKPKIEETKMSALAKGLVKKFGKDNTNP